MTRSHLLKFIAVMAMLAQLLAAKTTAPASGLTMRLMSWKGDLTGLWVADGGSYISVKAGEFVLGRPVFIQNKTPTVHFFREQTVDGTVRKQPVADVPIPANTSSVLVVLAPAPVGGPLPLQGWALDQSLAAYPVNTVRVVNFSDKTLAVRIDEKNAMLAPGKEEFFPFPPGGRPAVSVAMAVAAPTGWQMVQRSLQAAPEGRRLLAIVRDGRPDYSVQDPALRTKPVDIVFLVDRAVPNPPTMEPGSLAQR